MEDFYKEYRNAPAIEIKWPRHRSPDPIRGFVERLIEIGYKPVEQRCLEGIQDEYSIVLYKEDCLVYRVSTLGCISCSDGPIGVGAVEFEGDPDVCESGISMRELTDEEKEEYEHVTHEITLSMKFLV